MKILVTAGNTMTMIDQVRGITNIFKGKTGSGIAKHLLNRGHQIILLTSNPEIVDLDEGSCNGYHIVAALEKFQVIKYKTYDDLYTRMKELITTQNFDVIIHSVAVSDYKTAGVYVQAPLPISALIEVNSTTKISSDHKEIFLKLVPTEKIIDRIREWGFKGILVKFKLQVGISDQELVEIAKKSRVHSDADLIVANTLEGSKTYAYIIGKDEKTINVSRKDLAEKLNELILDVWRRNHE